MAFVGVGVLLVGAGVEELPAGLGVDVPVEFVDDGVLDVVVLGLLVDGGVDTVEVTGEDLFGVVGEAGEADEPGDPGDFDDD